MRRVDELALLDALLVMIGLLLTLSFFLQPPPSQQWEAYEAPTITQPFSYPAAGYPVYVGGVQLR